LLNISLPEVKDTVGHAEEDEGEGEILQVATGLLQQHRFFSTTTLSRIFRYIKDAADAS
jgi:hypothetical protein